MMLITSNQDDFQHANRLLQNIVIPKTKHFPSETLQIFRALGIAGIAVLTAIGTWFRGPNWHFYWSPSDWPAAH